MRTMIPTLLCLVASAVAADDIESEVRCREIGFSVAAERQDMEAFRAFIDADARFVGVTVKRGVEDIASAWSVFFQAGGPTIKWRPAIVEVLDNGARALSRGPYRVVRRDEQGQPVEQWGTFNSVWRLNDDGRWRVVFDAGSPAAEPPDLRARALLDADDDCG